MIPAWLEDKKPFEKWKNQFVGNGNFENKYNETTRHGQKPSWGGEDNGFLPLSWFFIFLPKLLQVMDYSQSTVTTFPLKTNTIKPCFFHLWFSGSLTVKVSLSSLFIIFKMTMQPWIGAECNFLSHPLDHVYYYNNTANTAMNFHNANSVIYDCTSSHYRETVRR